MGTEFSQENTSQHVVLTTHSHLAPRLKKENSYISTPLWAFMASFSAKFPFTVLWWNTDNDIHEAKEKSR